MNMEKIEAWLKQLDEKSAPYFKKAEMYLQKGVAFIKSHKAFSIIIAVSLAVFITVFAVVYNILDLINYDDGSNYNATDTSAVNGMQYLSYTADDGSLVFVDGSYMTPTGAAVLCDGTTIYPTGIVVFTDGNYIVGSGIALSADGTATFPDAKQLHITGFYVQQDGKIVSRLADGSVSAVSSVSAGATLNTAFGSKPLGQVQSNPTPDALIQNVPGGENDEEAFDNVIVDIYDSEIDEEIKADFIENDKLIDNNLDDNQIWYSDSVMNILLLGIDAKSNSDAMVVVSINKDTKDVKLVSFSRVAYVAIEGYSKTRLSHAHRYGGPQLIMDTIEKNYKIRIDNYISTTFENFMQAIDLMGGVDIGLTKAELDTDIMHWALSKQGYTNFQPNVYNLNGYAALNYVRLRSIDSDKERTQRQRNVLEALVKKAKQMSIIQIGRLIEEIFPLINTDLSKTQILSQLVNVYSYLSGGVTQYIIPHKGYEIRNVDGFDVAMIKWDVEVPYVHELFYAGLDVKYKTF